MSSTRSSSKSTKRTASDAQLAPDVTVVQSETIVIDSTPASASATSAAAAAPEESLAHKAKKLATDASIAVQPALAAVSGAVKQGIDAAGKAADTVVAAVEKKLEDRKSTSTVTKAPYDMKAEPSVVVAGSKKDEGMVAKAQLMASQAGAAIVQAAKSAEAKVEVLGQQAMASLHNSHLGADIKAGAERMAASVTATASQLSSSLQHKTGSEVGREDKDKDTGVSDASHYKEKSEGSLPTERNADEFPQGKQSFETQADSTLKPGQSGLGTDRPLDAKDVSISGLKDVPLGAQKIDGSFDQPGAKAMQDTQPDLLTGNNAQVTV